MSYKNDFFIGSIFFNGLICQCMNFLGSHFIFMHFIPCIIQLVNGHGKHGLCEAKGQQGSQQRKFFHSTPLKL